ncbi:MAG: hypothetical protein KC800_05815 [Candidatus Eremiobacteraeota bacterium]|nr:hypothetical protein [Candidatus Eremiobacteraeota bacterium]
MLMIGLGQLVTLGNSSDRIHEMRLFREIASVDEKEAEQGALHSDVLRLNSRDRDDDAALKKGLTHRLSRLWQKVRAKPESQKPQKSEEDCPVAQARAQSVVGENAPLGWLTFDHMDEEQRSAPGLEKSLVGATSKEKPDPLAFLKTDPEDHDYMFCEEWFLSPCG